MQGFASRAQGIDLSPGMLARARERGLEVHEGSATALPFPSEHFDVVCSFKVLAHVVDIGRALAEMVRVTRPGGTVVAEFYNAWSLRAVVKRFGPAGRIGARTTEADVYTRFDSPAGIRELLPEGASVIDTRGVRIVTPVARALHLPLLGSALSFAERSLCDGPLARFGGFWIAAIQKER
jgi:SAM-dependent methyltransferase